MSALGTISKISHYVNANIPKCKKEKSKMHVSQAFWMKDNQPVFAYV